MAEMLLLCVCVCTRPIDFSLHLLLLSSPATSRPVDCCVAVSVVVAAGEGNPSPRYIEAVTRPLVEGYVRWRLNGYIPINRVPLFFKHVLKKQQQTTTLVLVYDFILGFFHRG